MIKKKGYKILKTKELKSARKLPYGLSLKTFNKFKKRSGINKHLKLNGFLKLLKVRIRFISFLHQLNKLTGQKLITQTNEHIKFLKKIRNTAYFRHRFSRPVRGQRTKTNAKTQKKFKRLPI